MQRAHVNRGINQEFYQEFQTLYHHHLDTVAANKKCFAVSTSRLLPNEASICLDPITVTVEGTFYVTGQRGDCIPQITPTGSLSTPENTGGLNRPSEMCPTPNSMLTSERL